MSAFLTSVQESSAMQSFTNLGRLLPLLFAIEIIQTDLYQWNKNMVVEKPPDKIIFTAAAVRSERTS